MTLCRIYVDPLMTCTPNKNWKWPRSSHMFVKPGTHLMELHKFAQRIGLKREWFQGHLGKLPHYDLHPSKHRRALSLGAEELSREEAVVVFRQWRKELQGPPHILVSDTEEVRSKCCASKLSIRDLNSHMFVSPDSWGSQTPATRVFCTRCLRLVGTVHSVFGQREQ